MLEQNAAWFKIEGKTDNFGFVYDRGINFYSLKKLDLTIKKNPNDPAVNKIEFDITKVSFELFIITNYNYNEKQ